MQHFELLSEYSNPVTRRFYTIDEVLNSWCEGHPTHEIVKIIPIEGETRTVLIQYRKCKV